MEHARPASLDLHVMPAFFHVPPYVSVGALPSKTVSPAHCGWAGPPVVIMRPTQSYGQPSAGSGTMPLRMSQRSVPP